MRMAGLLEADAASTRRTAPRRAGSRRAARRPSRGSRPSARTRRAWAAGAGGSARSGRARRRSRNRASSAAAASAPGCARSTRGSPRSGTARVVGAVDERVRIAAPLVGLGQRRPAGRASAARARPTAGARAGRRAGARRGSAALRRRRPRIRARRRRRCAAAIRGSPRRSAAGRPRSRCCGSGRAARPARATTAAARRRQPPVEHRLHDRQPQPPLQRQRRLLGQLEELAPTGSNAGSAWCVCERATVYVRGDVLARPNPRIWLYPRSRCAVATLGRIAPAHGRPQEQPLDLAPVTTATLAAFSDAWNRHDVDALMSS